MAYPTKPSIQTSYTAVEQAQGDGSLPGQELDVDFAGLKFSVDALNDFVRGITRSDGRLANASVSRETLGPDILIGFDAPETWETGRDYVPPQTVFESTGFYLCVIEHESDVFADDLAAGRWELLVDFSAVLTDAEATLAEFRTRYLGAAAADPALDPAGGALIDGALYWNTGARRLKVYDLATTAWYFVSPTAAELTNINTVAGISADVTSVAGVSASVPAVAAIDTNVTTVAGISANVTTVAGIAPNVTTVAGVSADVTTVAGIAPNVTTVAGVAADVTSVVGISADVTAVAGIAPDVTTVAGISADVKTVATNITDVTNFADVYLGPAASDPTVRSDGSALQAGDLYFNTVSDDFRVYDGAAWRSVVFGAVPQTSDTGAAEIPVGTEAQRPTPAAGQLRFNSDEASFEGYNGTEWGAIGGGGGLEPGDSLVSARPLGLPEFISQPGTYLKADFPLIGDLSAFFAQAIDWSSVTSGFGSTRIRGVATDGDGTWVAVGVSGTMTRSTDNGATWSAVSSGFGSTQIQGVATDGSGVWVAFGSSGTMTRSTDNGASWSSVTSGFGSATIVGVATDGSGTWVAVGSSTPPPGSSASPQGVMTRSTNNGASWSTVTSGFGSTRIQGVATDGDGTWVAVGNSGTMRRSTNNGLNWSSVTSGFGSTTIQGVATDANGTWVAVGSGGIMTRSTSNGLNWSFVSSGFGSTTITDVATDGDDVWVAVGSGGTMTRSTDNGATWSAVSSGFGSTVIEGVATDGDDVWVAVGRSGIMTRSEPSATEFFVSNVYAEEPRYLFTGETA